MLQLRQLRTFLAAADTLSFTKAAGRVHLSQPSVTEQIRALEQALGKPLFNRMNSRLTLTNAGHNLASRARELLAMADATFVAIRDDEGKTPDEIRVAGPQTLCTRLVAPVIGSLLQGGIAARVSLLERDSARTEQCVCDGTADVGVLHGWPRSSDLTEVEVIARDAPVVMMPVGHPLASRADVEDNSLALYPLLLTPPGCRYRDYIEALLQKASVRPVIRGEAGGASSLGRMVASGAGLAVLPRLAAEAGAAGLSLEIRPLRGAGDGLPVCLVRPSGRPSRPALSAFVGLLRASVVGLDESLAALDVQDFSRGVSVS